MSTSLPRRRERLPPPLSDIPPTAQGFGLRSSGLLRLLGVWAGLLFYVGALAVAAFLDEPWRSVGIVVATLLFAPVASLVQRWLSPDHKGDDAESAEAEMRLDAGDTPDDWLKADDARAAQDEGAVPWDASPPP